MVFQYRMLLVCKIPFYHIYVYSLLLFLSYLGAITTTLVKKKKKKGNSQIQQHDEPDRVTFIFVIAFFFHMILDVKTHWCIGVW